MRVSNGGIVNNVLVIGDLHEPFSLDKYLEFCVSKYEQFDCTEVVFIGDIIDNHYASYHETNADGMGGADELEYAIQRIARWYKAFPKATIIIGNHDRMVMRKAQTSSIPSCEHYVGQNFRVFGMQVGTGIKFSEYSFAYAKAGKKPAIGCGVVLRNGKLPINLLMEL